MKIKIPATCCLLFVLAGLGLSEETKQQAAAATNATPASASVQSAGSKKAGQFHVIGYLETRDRVITIKSGPKGTVYSVATKDGKILHENLSAEQLKAQAPEIHDFIKTGVGRDARVRISAVR